MEIITNNTNTLAPHVYTALRVKGEHRPSRNGPVLSIPGSVTIGLLKPWERVHFSARRDANPFFHLFEALAMLTDLNSAPLMGWFVKNMLNFSEDGKTFNAFYGTRARTTWGDQVSKAINELQQKPESRQAVVQLWDPRDLDSSTTLDKACNLCMIFSVTSYGTLQMTTFNRSNDAVLGFTGGANIVHLSMFQEYVACALGRKMGAWYHTSANFHTYVDPFGAGAKWDKVKNSEVEDCPNHYETFLERGEFCQALFPKPNRGVFDLELREMMKFVDHTHSQLLLLDRDHYSSEFLYKVAVPAYNAYVRYRQGEHQAALMQASTITSPDWRMACTQWLGRRVNKAKGDK